MFRSFRSRLILASLLWTGGLLLLMHLASMFFIHTLPSFRSADTHVWIAMGVVTMIGGLLAARASLVTLRTLRSRVEEVSGGTRPRVDGRYPREVQPLIDSLNRLLDDRERSIARANAAAGDLAHGLKTPLALLAREAETARAAGHSELAEAIALHVQRMSNHIDYHLARSRIVVAGTVGADRSAVGPCVDALSRTLLKLYADHSVGLESSVEPGLQTRVRAEDLEEMLGNVLDNAFKWARSRVKLAAVSSGASLTVTIEDDGPGLPAAKRESVLERGVRLDESAPGSGLGLSIVRELVEHYGGSLSLGESPLGGLLVTIQLPAA